MNIDELRTFFNEIIIECGFDNEFSITEKYEGDSISLFAFSSKTNTIYTFYYNVCAYIFTCNIASSEYIKRINDQQVLNFFYKCSINEYKYISSTTNDIESSLCRFFFDIIRGNKIGYIRKGWPIEISTTDLRSDLIKAFTCFYEFNSMLCSTENSIKSLIIPPVSHDC